MKRKWITIVGVVLLVGIFTTVAFADNPIKLFVNGREIKPDDPPQLINGRTMVPIRWVAEALGADVQWDEQNRTVDVYLAEKLEADLVSQYLRTADTPKHFIENFTHTLQVRNGAAARLFLNPEIREQIKPEVIGPSTLVKKIEINETADNGYTWTYNVKAYYGSNGNQPLAPAFEMNITVEPERYPDGLVVPGRYFITKLDWISRW